MMLKKFLAILGVMAACGSLHTQSLDDAIKNAASEISSRLESGSAVAVIGFQSQSTRLTDYAIDELNNAIVNIGKLRPVERRQLDAVRSELNFDMSGEVSDESAQSIGRMLGARYIVTGSIEVIGSLYRIRFQAIATETATIQYAFSENISNNSVLESLLQGTNYLVDFTFNQRLGASALNLLLGTGSFFIEGDGLGGGITAAVEGLGVVSIITAVIIKSAFYNPEDPIIKTYDAAYPFFIGIGLYAGGAIYGIIRAATYHKHGSQMSMLPIDGLRMDLVSSGNNDMGFKISYTWRF
jgi:TolB-like protein